MTESLFHDPRELRKLGHHAVTEGVNLAYVERMRKALYAAADRIEELESGDAQEASGHLFDGSFELAWLRPGECVRANGSPIVGGCEIATKDGRVICQLVPGDVLRRRADGYPYVERIEK